MFPGGAVNRPTSMSPILELFAPSRTSAAGIPRAAARLLMIATTVLSTGCATAVPAAKYTGLSGTRPATIRSLVLPVSVRSTVPVEVTLPEAVASVVPLCMADTAQAAQYSSLLLKSWLAADDVPAREWRTAAGLSQADTSSVALANDPTECARAAVAVSTHNREPFGELTIAVYRVHGRYVVTWADGASQGGWQSYLTFDDAWRHLATFGT